jgi:hypothetical protein
MKGVHVPFDAGRFALDTKEIASLVRNFTATSRRAVSGVPRGRLPLGSPRNTIVYERSAGI